MKLTELEQISEVPMNPGAFAQGVEPGTMLHTMAMKTIVANMKEKLRKEKLIGQGR